MFAEDGYKLCINCGEVILNPEYVKFSYCEKTKCQEAYLKKTRRITKEINRARSLQNSRINDNGSRLTDRLDDENDDFRLTNWSGIFGK